MREAVKAKKEKREAYLAQKRDEKRAQRELDKIAKAEHEKRMAELRAQYLDDNATDGSGGPGTPAEIFFDENSQSSLTNMSTMSARKRQKWGDVGSTEMSSLHNPLAHVTAETLFEYKWPLDGRNSEHYFLQVYTNIILWIINRQHFYQNLIFTSVAFFYNMKLIFRSK